MPSTVLRNPFVKPTPTPQQQPQQQPNPQNPNPTPVDPTKSINDPTNKGAGVTDPTKKEGVSDDPMLDFPTLWEDPPEDPNNPKTPEETTFLPTIDPTKISEMLGKIDFTKNSTPEEAAAIKAGGDGAEAAHRSVLNKSIRQAMLTSFNVTQRMMESGLTKAQERFLGKVPGHVKDIIVQSSLTKSSKIMSNPAFAPLIESTRQRFQEKFPKATPDQISSAVEKYMQDFVKAASPEENPEETDNAQKLAKGVDDADWDKWIEPELKK